MPRDRATCRPSARPGAKSAITCHLAPRLDDLLLSEVSKATLDQRLMWPLQERYAPVVRAPGVQRAGGGHAQGTPARDDRAEPHGHAALRGLRRSANQAEVVTAAERDLPDLLAKLASWRGGRVTPAGADDAVPRHCLGETQRQAQRRYFSLPNGSSPLTTPRRSRTTRCR